MRIRELIAILWIACAAPVLADEIFVDETSSLRWLANSSDPGIGEGWVQPAFDDSGWSTGSYGIGYDTTGAANGLFNTTVPSGSSSIYTRVDFNVTSVAALTNLYLGIDYDDGYVVWLNGVEVARASEMPIGPTSWNSASNEHESSNGATPLYDWIDLSGAGLSALNDGANVLAIGVWNDGGTSSDLVLHASLIGDKTPLLVRGPYLQMPTSDSIELRWRTDIPTSSSVDCGSDLASMNPCASDMTLRTDHALTVDSLAADSSYFYAIGDGSQFFAGNDPAYTFRTAPLLGDNQPRRIWIVGDSGTADANARAVRDAYNTFTTGTETDLWLMLGDNAYPNGTDAEYQRALFETYDTMLRTTPVFPTFGNHDADSSNAVSRSGPYFDIFRLPTAGELGGVASGTEAYYSFDYGNVHFVVLDSQTSDRSPGSTMLTWLEADLANTAQDWIIAYWHHPPYSKGSHDSDNEQRLYQMRENVVPILEDYGVDLVFTGHSHSYERSFLIDGHYGTADTFNDNFKVDLGDGNEAGDGAYQKPNLGPEGHRGTVYTVAGSSGRLSGGPLDHPAMLLSLNELGSVVLDVAANRIDARFIDQNGSILDHFTMTKGAVALPPSAEFGAFPLVGQAPLTVQWIDRSSNIPTSWEWDFDNDTIIDSNAESPMHTYTTPGIYSVSLSVANAFGGDSVTSIDLVCVHNGIPTSVSGFGWLDKQTLSWLPTGVAGSRYDVVQGDLNELRANGWADAQQACVATDTDQLQATDSSLPAPGEFRFYLARARNCASESGSFDSDGVGQVASRDIEIQGAQAACGCGPGEDLDGDGLCANLDNCPTVATSNRNDIDNDGIGDACDSCPIDPLNDIDGDFSCANVDNCPTVSNPLQVDVDQDGVGDLCDGCTDTDADGAGNPGFPVNVCPVDNCPATPNPGQEDNDLDGLGNLCDSCPNDPLDDADGDGICGDIDNCPDVANALQEDADGDGVGDACDSCTDLDGDGAGDSGFPANSCPLDNCPATPNPAQMDSDSDGLGDLCDSCIDDPANDFDGDGICGDADNCPFVANPAQNDPDADGLGDLCDPCPLDALNDIDGDFVCGEIDNCPTIANGDQLDADGDLAGDVCDADDDNDGVDDLADCAPLSASLAQIPPTIGNSLQIDKIGGGMLLWERADQGFVSNIYRSVRAVGQPANQPLNCAVAETPALSWSESAAAAPGMVLYYLVSARNGCGESAAGIDSGGAPVVPAPSCPALHADFDSDGVEDWVDNCPLAANPDQADGDGDFIGDACDPS